MKQLISALFIGSSLLITIGKSAHAQGFLGQPVQVQYLYPTSGTVFENDGIQTVTAGGVNFSSIGEINTLILPTQVIQTYTVSLLSVFTPAAFNGFEYSEVGGSPLPITGVTIDATSDLPGFVPGDITFDATDIFINEQSILFDSTNQLVLDVSFGSAPATPEPGAIALLGGMGISGAAFLRRRRTAAQPR
jgi:hypothetical protein